MAELACYGAFESDDEVDEFIAFTYAQRRTDITHPPLLRDQ